MSVRPAAAAPCVCVCIRLPSRHANDARRCHRLTGGVCGDSRPGRGGPVLTNRPPPELGVIHPPHLRAARTVHGAATSGPLGGRCPANHRTVSRCGARHTRRKPAGGGATASPDTNYGIQSRAGRLVWLLDGFHRQLVGSAARSGPLCRIFGPVRPNHRRQLRVSAVWPAAPLPARPTSRDRAAPDRRPTGRRVTRAVCAMAGSFAVL